MKDMRSLNARLNKLEKHYAGRDANAAPVEELPLSRIRLDGETQPREAISQDLVTQYAEDLVAGIKLPPIKAVFDGTDYWAWDGFHRHHAHKAAELETILAEVTTGTIDVARWLASSANKDHDSAGRRRTNADKRKAVEMALATVEGRKKSDSAIAQHCGVSQPTVSSIRKSLKEFISEDRRTGRDGRTINTANIGKPKERGPEFPQMAEVYATMMAEGRLWVCDCGETFDKQVWHCPICAHHWLSDDEECRNCHKGKRRGAPVATKVEPEDDDNGGDDDEVLVRLEPTDSTSMFVEEDDLPDRIPLELTNGHIPKQADYITLESWSSMAEADRRKAINEASGDSKFNDQKNNNIEWALWSWNPVSGCLHNCPYCYARDIAERFYAQKFTPSLYPSRLNAPRNTKVPSEANEWMGHKNVFTCSMADLFGRWVPAEWIEAVLEAARGAPQWNFLFLTKFPQRLSEFEFPDNAWVGTTVDCQARVANAEKAFKKVKAGVKWLSCEPMIEPLKFSDLSMFDWLVLGGASKSTQTPEWHPPRSWVYEIEMAAAKAKCRVYEKTNLLDRIRQYPGVDPVIPKKAPAELCYLPTDK